MKPMLCAFALALLLGPVAFAADKDPEPPGKKLTKEDVEKAEKAVKAHLAKVNGSHAQVNQITDDSVATVLPGYAFFSVLFRQFPVGRVPPARLKASNVFVVARDGKPVPLTSAKELEKFFKDKLPAVSSKKRLEAAATAWVRLSQEFIQDGFYKFTLEKDATKVVDRKPSGRSAIAKVVVMQGGNGTLLATLYFNKSGKLAAVKEESKIRPGPRPICQATKLLDRDPIVRGMAEQALLCMGRACKYYLDEQRGKASPALKKAIDRIWKRILETDR